MVISKYKGSIVSCLILLLLLLPACKEVGEGLTKVVMMEYEQSLNFFEYKFEKTVIAPGPSSNTEWDQIRIHDQTDGGKRGIWILYQICSIRNDAPKAQPFTYDITKFYVEYNNKKHYFKSLVPYTYENSFNNLVGAPDTTTKIAPAFRLETQTGPDTQIISPGSNDLSVSWRFVIYVSTDLSDKTDLTNLNLPLHYDATPVNMINRNNDTVPNTGVVEKGNLPVSCKPPFK